MKAGFILEKNSFTYPIQLHIQSKSCTVIGGGKVALRKVKSLLQAGAKITLVAPQVTPELLDYAKNGLITLLQRNFIPGDTKGAFLVIAATDNASVNEAIAIEAASHNQLVNVSSNPDLGNFTVPGTLQKGNLVFTVATGGTPALTKLITRELHGSAN